MLVSTVVGVAQNWEVKSKKRVSQRKVGLCSNNQGKPSIIRKCGEGILSKVSDSTCA